MTKHTKVDSPENQAAKPKQSAKPAKSGKYADSAKSGVPGASSKTGATNPSSRPSVKSGAAMGSKFGAKSGDKPVTRAGSKFSDNRKTSSDSPKTKNTAKAKPAFRTEQSEAAQEPVAKTSVSKASSDDEKLQKVLARAGLGSRREMERAIESGSVKVNERLAKLGDRVTPTDKIFFNGQRVLQAAGASRRRVILYNKPEGEICSRSDPEGRRTVYDGLPALKGERWISVGRLDFNTSGLLLFTNDGELANKLTHPSSVIDREYLVRIQGDVPDEMKQNLLEGVLLDDGVARFTDIVDGAGEGRNRWFYCVVMEGRNREVRRLWESQGVKVSRLKRVRYANIFIPSHVRVGQWMELSEREIADLCMTAGFDNNSHTKVMPPSRDEKMQLQRHENKLRSSTNSRRPPVPKRRKASDTPNE